MKELYSLILFCCICITISSQPIIGFSPIITAGLTVPVDIVSPKDGTDRLFIVQQNGIIKIDSVGVLLSTPFLDVSNIITYDGGERGLLSLAFHPNYANNRYFFIYYNDVAGNVTLAQYRTKSDFPNQADPASGKILMSIAKPFSNHNGAKLNFGPDGNLYLGTGDGGGGGDPYNNAQNGNSLLGKMIRINVDNFDTPPYYTIPSDNPFIGDPNVNDLIFALGLRNPWRWSFDRSTGSMWIADVGQNAWEEVNYVTPVAMKGANYGWRCYEGNHPYNLSECGSTPLANKIFPLFEYGHNAQGGFVITGGYVYRGNEFPSFQGYYVCCDYATGNGWIINSDLTHYTINQQSDFPLHISSFGEAEGGTLYAVTLDGTLYKLIVTGALPVKLISFYADRQRNNRDVLNWTTSIDPTVLRFEVERSTDGIRFFSIGNMLPQNTGNIANYKFNVPDEIVITRYYRLKIMYINGDIEYSFIVNVNGNGSDRVVVRYSSLKQFQLTSPYPLKQINIINGEGNVIKRLINVASGSQIIDMHQMAAGVYWLQCVSDKVEVLKVVNF